MKGKVLIIDDEEKICSLLARIIGLEGFKVFQAKSGKDGLKILRDEEILIVLSDIKLPDYHGVELVKEIKKISPATEVINLTAFGTIADGVMAMRNGAFDYITKGDDNDKIIPLMYKALDKALLNMRVGDLEKRITRQFSFDSILGESRAINDAIRLAKKVADTATNVLLLGETGTGKEVFAQAIHFESARRQKPFVALNCSAFSHDLLESELFGYKAGAFTGAMKDKKGLLEEANGGTIFLDEIGEMNLDMQAKLLRVLENQTYIKVGDTQTSHIDVRVISATNRDLKTEAEAGRFRLDLYYRVSVFSIELPSLSHRREDILPIAMHYLKEFTAKVNKQEFAVDKAFSERLIEHAWKGNVRELKNVMERVVILADGNVITPDLLPFEFHHKVQGSSLSIHEMEKNHIIKVLKHTHGNKTECSRLLGIGLTTLYRKIQEYQIEK